MNNINTKDLTSLITAFSGLLIAATGFYHEIKSWQSKKLKDPKNLD